MVAVNRKDRVLDFEVGVLEVGRLKLIREVDCLVAHDFELDLSCSKKERMRTAKKKSSPATTNRLQSNIFVSKP
jgi:hypothetical protein